MSKPVIAAINGPTVGAALSLVLGCDIRIASESVQFCVPEMGLGIITAAGASQTLPRVINRSPAMEILLSGRWVKAAEALRYKLVNQVVPQTDLLSSAEKLAKHINNMDPVLVRCIKESVGRGLDMSMDEGIELESRLAARVLNSSLYPA